MANNCECMQGNHIWDLLYDKEVKSERYCICCEHFFFSEDIEDRAVDNAIICPGLLNNSNSKSPSPRGFSKGKIVRRG
jgi:hypothetical protein